MYEPLLTRTHHLAQAFLDTLDDRAVRPAATFADLTAALGGGLPDEPEEATAVIERLSSVASPGLVASAGPRYFGFVIGGSTPATLAADWLVSTWDQNSALQVMSPAVAAIEEVTAGWLRDLLTLPANASLGFVTGATMANVTALAAARHELLRRAGWDVEANGLQGAPRLTVVAGAEAHASIAQAARLIGLGSATIRPVPADDQGRMRPEALREVLAGVSDAAIVCAQTGNVNTGACDALPPIADLVRGHGGWLHVDGAFGLWAAASPSHRHLVTGLERADSWTVDCHKWLNVPYDSGLVAVAHPAAHRAAMSQTASYLTAATGEERDGMDWTPEASRRARAVPIYAALRSLGRRGLAALIERCCRCAQRMASHLHAEPGVVVLNEIVLNQVLVRFAAGGRNITTDVIARVQAGGVCWVGGTRWRGEPAMRVSVSNWRTGEEDIDRAALAIVAAFRAQRWA